MKMKRFLCAVVALAATVSLCSCGENDAKNVSSETTIDSAVDNTSETDNVVHLKVWCEENNFEPMNKMIDSFKAKYEGQAEFDFTVAASLDSKTKDNILADIHHSADVFPMPDDQLSAMVAAGALEPVPNQEEIIAANLDEAAKAAMINDTLYAYPMTADNGYFLFYNKKYVSDTDAQTLDGILRACEKAGKKFSMEWNSGWYMYAFFGNTGLDFGINDDGVTNYCNWNSTEGPIKGVDIVDSLMKISASPAFESRGDGDFPAGVKDGTIAAGISGIWNAMEVQKAWGDNYAAAKLPTYSVAGQQVQMSSFTGYKMIGVNYYCENKEWACAFADWITNAENQTLRFVERNQVPSNKAAAASDEVMQVPAIQAVIAQSQYGKLQRVGNNYWAPFEEFGNVIATGNPDHLDPQEIIDKLVAEITATTVN